MITSSFGSVLAFTFYFSVCEALYPVCSAEVGIYSSLNVVTILILAPLLQWDIREYFGRARSVCIWTFLIIWTLALNLKGLEVISRSDCFTFLVKFYLKVVAYTMIIVDGVIAILTSRVFVSEFNRSKKAIALEEFVRKIYTNPGVCSIESLEKAIESARVAFEDAEMKPWEEGFLKTETKTFSREKENFCCVICLVEEEKEQEICKLNCGHRFHFSCIFSWFKQTPRCPSCKDAFRPWLLRTLVAKNSKEKEGKASIEGKAERKG